MRLLANNSQQDDPNGLRAIAELIQHGKADDFEQRVSARLPEIRRFREMIGRVRKVSGDVEYSPYVVRILSIADRQENAVREPRGARLAEVA